jgi:hypothetical protein
VFCVAVVNAMLFSSVPPSLCHHFTSFCTGSSPFDLPFRHPTPLSTACSSVDNSDILIYDVSFSKNGSWNV